MSTDVFDLPENALPAGPDFDTPGDSRDVTSVQRDRYGRYLLPDPDRPGYTLTGTRVTTLNKTIADTYLLGLWQQRMVALGLSRRPDLYAQAAVLGPEAEHRADLNRICADAQAAAGARHRAQLGTALHAFTELHDRGHDPFVPDVLRPSFDAYVALVASLPIRFEPDMIERVVLVKSTAEPVVGTSDRYATVTEPWPVEVRPGRWVTLQPGDVIVVDIKSGEDVLKFGQLEIAIQLGCYANGRGLWIKGTDRYDPMPARLRLDVGIVLHVPVGAGTAHAYPVDIRRGWEYVELCHQVRAARKVKDLFGADHAGRVPGPIRVPSERAASTIDTPAERAASTIDTPAERAASTVDTPAERAASTIDARPSVPALPAARVIDGEVVPERASGTSERVPAVEPERVPARMVTALSNGYPLGTRCIPCGREAARTGTITHTRGCPGSVADRRERDTVRVRFGQDARVPAHDLSAPERAPGGQAPAPERAAGVQVPAPERAAGVQAPAHERAAGVQAPAPERAAGVQAPAPERAAGVQAPAPERAAGVQAPVCTDCARPASVSTGLCPSCTGWRHDIDRATTRQGLSVLWRRASQQNEWTPELTAYGQARMRSLGL